MHYLDTDGIKNAFANHLKKHRGYSDEEAAIAVSDFPNPFDLPYLFEDYIDDVEIDGVKYEKNASYTLFTRCGIKGLPIFKFYTYYALDDIPHKQVGEYLAARKLFQVDALNPADFPRRKY